MVPIRNEAANLPRCLASVHWAAEVFVVDSHSTDGSPALAAALGAKVVQFDFHGTWPKKKNWALENLPFHHEWVFILDADEVLPPEAEEEIRRLVTAPANDFAGYWINRRFNFLGQWLRHAYYPNWNLRLFRHRLGRFEKLTEADTASGDNEVHEHVVVRGRTGRLRCELDHYAFPSIAVFVEKHNRYSNWEAQVALEPCRDGSGVNLQNSRANWRRRIRRWVARLPGRPDRPTGGEPEPRQAQAAKPTTTTNAPRQSQDSMASPWVRERKKETRASNYARREWAEKMGIIPRTLVRRRCR